MCHGAGIDLVFIYIGHRALCFLLLIAYFLNWLRSEHVRDLIRSFRQALIITESWSDVIGVGITALQE